MNDTENILTLLNQADVMLEAMYDRIAAKHRMNYSELMIFYLFSLHKEMTQKQLGEALHLSKSTVHSIILRLEKKNYLAYLPSNRKEKPLTLTEEGTEKMKEVIGDTHKEEENVLSYLGAKDSLALKNIAKKAIAYFKGVKNGD